MNKQNKETKNEEVVFEITFKITDKDYKISLATRRAWIIGFIIIALRFVLSFVGGQHP